MMNDKKGLSEFWFLYLLIAVVVCSIFYIHFLQHIRLDTEYNANLEELNTQPVITEHFDAYDDYSKVITKEVNDLSSYADKGLIIGWINVDNWREINSVDLELCDDTKCHTIEGIDNHLELEREANTVFENEGFEDYEFNCPNQKNNKWVDYMIVDGDNMVFWEYDKPLPIDMSRATITPSYQTEDMVIMDSFCKDNNPTNAQWLPPHGLIQYGFHYVDNGIAYLRNVRQTQMVSNGDHTRILSANPTPKDFIMRIKFTPTNIPEQPFHITNIYPSLKKWIGTPENTRVNNYVRVGWDFEDSWDAGHDQTLLYASLQYEYFGMQRVYPIVRQTKQGYEEADNKESLQLKNGRDYEINIKVVGQTAQATIYELKGFYYKKLAEVEYEFTTPRPETEYPISIEATGDIQIAVDSIELQEIQ